MAKNRIVCLLLSIIFSMPLIKVKNIQTPSEAEQLTEKIEFKNPILEEMIKVKEVEIAKENIEEEQVEETVVETKPIPTYNPYNIRELSNLTEEQICTILEGTALQTLSRAYYWVEQEYEVNALFLIALNYEESAIGRSSLAISHNNLGGVKSRNGGYAHFNDWGESLEYITQLISNEYLSENGNYFYGYSIWDINKKYCEQDTWAGNLNNIAYELLSKIN